MGVSRRSIAVVTGSRAEFGLLRTVIRALQDQAGLDVVVIAGGEHDAVFGGTGTEVTNELPDARTIEFGEAVAAINTLGAESDAAVAIAPDLEMDFGVRLGIEVVRNAIHLAEVRPDFVLVLGDRIEAFAAAAAAAVSGIRVAHMHGGDRAEGLVDESLRHAISKMTHLHLPATETSAHRLIAMGEQPARVHIVGSPAIDGLDQIAPMNEADFKSHGSPLIIVLLHPVGDDEDIEHERAARLLSIAQGLGPTLAMHPNHDPGRAGILRAIEESGCRACAHLPRDQFVNLLRRAKALVGNSSAGLIEAAAVPIWTVNVGRRQAGRERAGNVIDIENWDYQTIASAIRRALMNPIGKITHPFGDGTTGQRVATLLASIPLESVPLHKRNTY